MPLLYQLDTVSKTVGYNRAKGKDLFGKFIDINWSLIDLVRHTLTSWLIGIYMILNTLLQVYYSGINKNHISTRDVIKNHNMPIIIEN